MTTTKINPKWLRPTRTAGDESPIRTPYPRAVSPPEPWDEEPDVPERHAPTPEHVHEEKERRERGEALATNRTGQRLWFCRTCGKEAVSSLAPRGWYALARKSGDPAYNDLRLGMYCSLRCLAEQMPRLIGVDDDVGPRWTASLRPRQAFRRLGDDDASEEAPR